MPVHVWQSEQLTNDCPIFFNKRFCLLTSFLEEEFVIVMSCHREYDITMVNILLPRYYPDHHTTSLTKVVSIAQLISVNCFLFYFSSKVSKGYTDLQSFNC